ncbi:hypothetical protein KP509_02G041200 [Ceratopteris richardii]|uniref:Uncharacterized protein n=1 Tax=Ceratopteris richardii TaxID=49495 RepID=A0A8T2V8Q2_CERRI|nr:hypothetical protein KP509_02G041200 [Ceratopteris richardii]
MGLRRLLHDTKSALKRRRTNDRDARDLPSTSCYSSLEEEAMVSELRRTATQIHKPSFLICTPQPSQDSHGFEKSDSCCDNNTDYSTSNMADNEDDTTQMYDTEFYCSSNAVDADSTLWGSLQESLERDEEDHHPHEYIRSVHYPDMQKPIHIQTCYLHSSGRPTLEQEAMYGARRCTLDSEFEEYFASLLLNQ